MKKNMNVSLFLLSFSIMSCLAMEQKPSQVSGAIDRNPSPKRHVDVVAENGWRNVGVPGAGFRDDSNRMVYVPQVPREQAFAYCSKLIAILEKEDSRFPYTNFEVHHITYKRGVMEGCKMEWGEVLFIDRLVKTVIAKAFALRHSTLLSIGDCEVALALAHVRIDARTKTYIATGKKDAPAITEDDWKKQWQAMQRFLIAHQPRA